MASIYDMLLSPIPAMKGLETSIWLICPEVLMAKHSIPFRPPTTRKFRDIVMHLGLLLVRLHSSTDAGFPSASKIKWRTDWLWSSHREPSVAVLIPIVGRLITAAYLPICSGWIMLPSFLSKMVMPVLLATHMRLNLSSVTP